MGPDLRPLAFKIFRDHAPLVLDDPGLARALPSLSYAWEDHRDGALEAANESIGEARAPIDRRRGETPHVQGNRAVRGKGTHLDFRKAPVLPAEAERFARPAPPYDRDRFL